ncbi:unnamed protein product [Adineta ricciae]|uniref:RNA helicase n=1 Tax=Adineta ricciae TaxID=249248 RepID=A0A814LYU0_ADIRI|nr:unnamed protein product [Adineta ricciae]CAF1124635.1 unnamed protein product [Adineta ricciae]
MKRLFEDDTAPSEMPKFVRIDDITQVVNTENIEDFTNIHLKPFETSSTWSDQYLSSLNIHRRPFNFQIELVQSAIQSGNSIICLRTGAGKTYTCALLIKYYYLKKKQEHPDEHFSTFFFVPNRSIREQQVEAIRSVGDLQVIGCDDDSTADAFAAFYNVVVCTPQKFLNCLMDKTVHFNEIDLIVFDECHHCIGRHPYSQVMEQYLVYHSSEEKRPRILGLTASCGTKLTNPKAIIDELAQGKNNPLGKLYELCATLNCYDVVTVVISEHQKELDSTIPQPTQNQILTVQQNSFELYLESLKNKFCSLLQYIGSRCSPEISAYLNEQQLIEEKIEAEKKNNFTNIVLVKYMIMFVKRFDALSDLPLKAVMMDIKKKLDSFYSKKETPMPVESDVYNYCLNTIGNINEEIKHGEYYSTNPKLDFLTDQLKEQIKKRNANARGLILVSRTLYAKLILDYLKERQDIQNMIKPCWLVGQSGVDYQNSLSEQDRTLKEFRQGLANVMIATDIVQEGLDVAECSFMMRYEFVSGVIGTVQSRGRARADKSACFLIVGFSSINHTKEITNRMREKEMLAALNRWREVPRDKSNQDIQRVQNIVIQEWQDQAKNAEFLRNSLIDSTAMDGKVSCRSCNSYLGNISWLRKLGMNHFIPERQLVTQVEIERFEKPEIHKEIQVTGKVICGNQQCREDLGGTQQISNRTDLKEMCTLKCKQLKFSYKDNKGEERTYTFKKWSDITFKIVEIEPTQR